MLLSPSLGLSVVEDKPSSRHSKDVLVDDVRYNPEAHPFQLHAGFS